MRILLTATVLLAVWVAALALARKPRTPDAAPEGKAIAPAAKSDGAAPAAVTTYVVQSAALRLEVTSTYGYTVTEISTGNALLSENRVTFTVGSSSYFPTAISNVVTTAGTLDGDLKLSAQVTAHVNFTFTSADQVRVTLTCNNAAPSAIAERFSDVAGERYYGVWENALPTNLDNRGVSSGFDGKEVTTTKDVFASSARAPFFFTNNHFGIYANTQAQGSYAFGVSGNTTMTFNDASLQYTILHAATPKGILALHNALAGPAFMPPDWAFAPIYWRDDNHDLPAGAGLANAQALVMDDAGKLAAAHMHAGAIWLDRPYGTETRNVDSNVGGWGNLDFDASFPDPSAMTEALNVQGLKLLLWAANKANNKLYTDGSALGYLFTGYSLSPAIDLRNADAYGWYKDQISILDDAADHSYGRINGFKIDRGGEGEMPDAVINTETTLLQKALYENMQERNGGDFFNFSRNVNDQGRRYAAVWSGDPKITWLGLASSVKNGIRTGLVNFPMWGSDTGGYSPPTGWTFSEELFTRWVEFSAYCPMMEIIQGPTRNIFYDFSSAARANTLKYTNLHHDLIPYTRSAVASALRDGTPVMRALVLEFPSDANVADMADEYMFGPGILVAPVLTQGATSRPVYLPPLAGGGKWFDYNNPATSYSAGQTITAGAALDVIPIFVASGAIIPRGDIVQANNTWSAGWAAALHIDVFPGAAASTFDYYTGAATSTITLTPRADGYDLTAAAPGVPGVFNIYLPTPPVSVKRNGTALIAGSDYTYDTGKHILTVSFAGDQAIALNLDYAVAVTGRHVFYKGSTFASGSDDNAIATDKAALLPGATAAFANYTSYARGINGVMMDIAGTPGTFSASDFVLKIGNDNTPGAWPAAPAPVSVATRAVGAGVTRVVITWDDNAIQGEWLQVTLKGGVGSTSGLSADDTFYFGSAIGESGNDATSARVDALDELCARAASTPSALITNACDFNRDGVVDDADQMIARTHVTSFLNQLNLITAPAQ